MAGHVRFRARTGGALVTLGALLPGIALFFADSMATLFRVLGVILFFGGMELAAGVNAEAFSRAERIVLVVTVGIAPWNMGVAYLAGLLLDQASRRGIVYLDR